ncbi:MAG: acetylornithine deacetylase [Betaproteobacteria bacterium]|nr:acetylornithine deacetylase [Betaproteobacteria bacterium]
MNAPATLAQIRSPHDEQPVRPDELASLELIRKLVGFDTTSRESNLKLIEWVRGYLAGHGIESTLTFDDTGRKANLFATLPAQDGNAIRGGIVLSGHTDVVPVDGQPWDTDPFSVVINDGRLYGRGVTDMKSFTAAGLTFVPEFLRRGLEKPVHFALSYDEEVGCIGVRRLIADIVARGITPAGCIVGEPTGMQLVVAHKGKKSWRCRVRGFESHSALTPRGVNAVQIACEIVAYIARRACEFRNGERHDDSYDVPYTTVHVGVILGGTALNIVPRDCKFEFEIRHLPFDDPDDFLSDVRAFADQFLPEMHAVAATTHIEFDPLSTLPGFATEDTSDIASLGRACSDTQRAGKVSFGTEASLFHNAGIPTVICGPGHIAQAHQPNEWVTLEQIARCEAFMRRLADHVCAR